MTWQSSRTHSGMVGLIAHSCVLPGSVLLRMQQHSTALAILIAGALIAAAIVYHADRPSYVMGEQFSRLNTRSGVIALCKRESLADGSRGFQCRDTTMPSN
jgi:hypothetical protein